jgi:hypothetical protein
MKVDNISKVFRLISVGCLVIGIAFLVGAWFAYRSTSEFMQRAVLTTGTVVGSWQYRNSTVPVVQFETERGERIEFRSRSGRFSSEVRVPVLYDPRNPNDAEIYSTFPLWGETIFLSVFSVALSAAGLAGFIYFSRERKKDLLRAQEEALDRERLRASGRRITTAFQRLVKDRSQEVKGRHPYIIVTKWYDREKKEAHIFKSDPVWIDPENFDRMRGITVYADPQDMNKYYVDTSFLSEKMTAGRRA